jgi:hypothetical protein
LEAAGARRYGLVEILFRLETELVNEAGESLIDIANTEAFRRLRAGQPVLRRIRPAHECIPGMTKTTINHAGPPIRWEDMCGPMRGAYIGVLKYEGLAETDAEAEDSWLRELSHTAPTTLRCR